MYQYRILGQIVKSPTPLSAEQQAEIRDHIQSLYGGVEPDVPTPENIERSTDPVNDVQQPTLSFTDSAVEMAPDIGGMAGGMAGFALGGPPGAVIGAGTGGGAGEVVRDMIKGESSHVMDVAGEAVKQATFEASGNLIAKVGGRFVMFTADALKAAGISRGADPTMAVNMAIQKGIQPFPLIGSTESKAAAQGLLQEGVADTTSQRVTKATLTQSQTGEVGPIKNLVESVGRIGVLGSGVFKRNMEDIRTIIQTNLDRVLQGPFGRVRDPSEIGETYIDLMNSARMSLSENYGKGLDEVQQKFSKGFVDTRGLKLKAQSMIDEAKVASESGKPTLLESETIDQLKQILDLPDSIRGDQFLLAMKKLNQKASSFLEKGTPGYNSVAYSEVTGFMTDTVRPFIDNSLKAIDEDAFKAYDALNSNYSTSVGTLTPELMKSVARRGKVEDFVGVGTLLFDTTNPEKIKAAFKAIQEAKKINPDLNTANAMDALRQGYLLKVIGPEGRNLDNVVSYARKLETDANAELMFNEVLGASAPGVRKIMTAMAEASDEGTVGFLSLVLRGKEAQGLQALATAGATMSGDMQTIAGAAAVLATPYVFAKIATNPKAVNKLLNLNKASAKMAPRVLAANLIRFGEEFGIPIEEKSAELIREIQESDAAAKLVQQVTQ